MPDILSTQSNFRSLSVKDLLQARDLYHWHLMNKANVVGTAIGLYLIRKTDPPPGTSREIPRTKAPKGERTFANSEVRSYSWPCVLALVRNWVGSDAFGTQQGELAPEEMVPKTLYMPDGRMVPVCVVKVEQGEPDPATPGEWHWPTGLFGGGMPILVRTQGEEHRATLGCLVTDGHTTYGLTSRHVCGATGEPVFTIAGHQQVEVGVASRQHLTRKPFDEVYPEFPARRTYMNLDVGLIELHDVGEWTSQVYGLGPMGALADLNELNISLRLIDAPVVATGAASGRLEGRIKALFYRYRSVGGYDYVSDFLIAPRALDGENRTTSTQTKPGDSGAVWHLVMQPATSAEDCAEPADEFAGDLRPLALEWGGQVFVERARREQFAFSLATSLTTVCRALDVELVLEHNTGVLPYWGQLGHYSIAAFAAVALPAGALQTFVEANVDRISFARTSLTPSAITKALKEARVNEGFVPLADVPDIIWKQHETKLQGGRDTQWAGHGRSTGPEHPTHYADIDEPHPNTGQTLRQMCVADPANVSVPVWQQFYDEAGHAASRDRGLLPFRVWQFFDAMEDFARNGEPDKFLCAAGLLSHYVGDACQPLHGSMYADGYADQPLTVTHHRRETGEEYEEESHMGAGVHSGYETKMVDRHATEIVTGIEAALQAPAPAPALPPIRTGKEAAEAIVQLMERTAVRIPPTELVDCYIDAGNKPIVSVQDAMWDEFQQQTIDTMADGARVLAAIWQGAWAAGNGDAIAANTLTTVPQQTLMEYYLDTTFVESVDLDHIEALLRQPVIV